MKKILIGAAIGLILGGCSTVQYQTSTRCINYSVTGDDVSWTPIKYYQDKTDLYMELPESTKFVPKLQVIDTEWDEASSVPYTYNQETHTLRIQDNYDMYLLSRSDALDIHRDKLYIKCNRKAPITNQETTEDPQ